MTRTHGMIGLAVLTMLAAAPAAAQDGSTDATEPPRETANRDVDSRDRTAREVRLQYFRPADQRGLNIFEAPKESGVAFTGFTLELGGSFAQQFQALGHENGASPRFVDGVDANELADLGWGFNLAAANLSLDAQLASGIRVAMTMYLSSRHHPEAWVKDGYLQIDQSPLAFRPLERLMDYATVRAGHFEINYGDAHFRRTDNGHAVHNPFVENYILDAFTTEVGAELYLRRDGWIAMGAVTGGEIKGSVLDPERRAPAFIGKLGFDRKLRPDLRVRLTGSAYTTSRSANNTLYGGDRAGSRYFFVMENTAASESGQFTSGRMNPGFRDRVTAVMVNPFVKTGGLELFGLVERASGRAANEAADRVWNQYAADIVYRFLTDERLYVGARYNRATGELAGIGLDVAIDRTQLGAGWFVTPSILLKAEYVTQAYDDFPLTDIRHGGHFDGLVIEGAVAF